MRLYVEHCGRAIFLGLTAADRNQLAEKIGYVFQVECPDCGVYHSYTVKEVYAKRGPTSTAAGAIMGGLIGLLGGPLGMLIGGLGGTAWGARTDQEEDRRVDMFSRS